MKFHLHTIILLCGPSCCGKSHYAKNRLIPQLRALQRERRLNIQYVASDDLRRQVLGDPAMDLREVRNSFPLRYASDAAFRLLETTVEQVTRFPVHAEFVIIDTTALSEEFRRQMIDIAAKNHYHIDLILFDLPVREYYRYCDSNDYVANHVKRFHREVLPNLKSRFYHQVLRFKDRDNIPPVEEIEGLELFERCHFPEDAIVVGDLHGCYDALLKIEQVSGDLPIILLGDVIDKGPQSLEVLRHLQSNPQKYPRLVLGNHESYTHRFLNGMIDESPKHDYYTSLAQYEGNAEFKELIDWYCAAAVPFVRIRDSVYVTHAPCESKFIGKVDAVSARRQRYRPITDDLLDSISADADDSHPRHLFGHAAFERPYRCKNKFGIDTGGVYGNLFTYYRNGKMPGIPASATYSENKLIEVADNDFDLDGLEPGERRRIEIAVADKINYVSGTIAPCASDVERMKIEPIEQAIDKFRSMGITVVHVQQKYMGSRCEAYISRDLEQCRLTSRRGYRIRRLHAPDGTDVTDLTPVYESILAQPKILALFGRFPEAETILLDGELMPWYALGKGLIEDLYQVVTETVQSEYDLLKESGFEEQLQAEFDHPNFTLWRQTPEVPDTVINQNKKTTYRLLKNFRHLPIAEMEEYLQIFREQVAIYGTPKPIDYNPFDILKIINADGSERLFRNTPVEERYNMVSKDTGLLVDLNVPEEVDALVRHFNDLPPDIEGVVIKCNAPGRSKVNALKVRNEKYLTIIYGYDYLEPAKKAALIHKKNVAKKLLISNREYELGWDLAAIPRNQINEDNGEYQRILAGLIFEERKETVLDPRL